MPVFSKDGKAYLFMHIPKTGGTAIEKLFEDSGYLVELVDHGWSTERGWGNSLNPYRYCPPQHYHAKIVQSFFDTDRFDGVFMIVRNPYDRFVSEYRFRKGAALTNSPDEFAAWTESMLDQYQADNYMLSNHMRPQCEFQLPNMRVYPLERGLDVICRDLQKVWDLDLQPMNFQVFTTSPAGKPAVAAADIVMPDSVRQRLAEFYAKDFKQYRYEV